MNRKICFVTGTRAEYGLLMPLIKEVNNDISLNTQIIVTGMHLSPEFGFTVTEIENDFIIDKRIEILLSSDSGIGISKSMGLAQISFSEAFTELNPDIIVLLGDRFEIFAAASAAMILKIPIAHLDGGETTEGAFDESIRHAITKMSHLHFTCAEEYKNRVIQLGESPDRVFNVGSTFIDNIKNLKLLTKIELEKNINFKFNKKNLSITFHPVTLETNTSVIHFKELLNALDSLEDTNFIFTKSNADTDGRKINDMIDKYVLTNSHKSISFTSMGYLNYLSSLQYVDAVVGNSSSGLTEAPFLKIPTINIGDRQKGRIRVSSIIDCEPISLNIKIALNQVYSKEMKNILRKIKSPYGDGTSSKKIKKILKSYYLENILKKSFFDLEYNEKL